MLLSGIILGAVLWLVNHAQPANAAAPSDAQAPAVGDADLAQDFRLIEHWVAAGKVDPGVPGEPGEPGEAIPVSGLSAVRVTLRWDGLRVGIGDAFADADAARGSGWADILGLSRLATTRALHSVEETLDDARRRAASAAPATQPATTRPAAELRDVGPKLTVDLQLALRLEPIRLPADAPPSAVYSRFVPGWHGLRMTRPTTSGQPDEAWLWPASTLAGNVDPRSQLVQLLTETHGSVAQLRVVARPGGPALDRFTVLHMARASLHAPATQLIRGNVVLPPSSVTARTLEGMIERLASHLIHRVRPDGAVAGTYLPSSDTYDSNATSDEEQALTAYALTRWAHRGTNGEGDARRAAAMDGVKHIVDALLTRFHTATQAPEPASAALLLMTLTDTPELGDRKADRDALGRRLATLDRDGEGLAAPVRALVLAAQARLYEQTRDAELGVKVRRSCDAMWAKLNPRTMVAALPWLMTAEGSRVLLEHAGELPAAATTAPAGATAQDRLDRIRNTIKLLLADQVDRPPAQGPTDVVGGFAFDAGDAADRPDATAAPNPTWHSAYAVAFLAAALRMPGVTPPRERLDVLLDCGLGARYLAQLMFDEPSCFYVRNPDDAMGGVRLALWDNHLAVAPTAMTLLATMELEHTLAAMTNDGGLDKR